MAEVDMPPPAVPTDTVSPPETSPDASGVPSTALTAQETSVAATETKSVTKKIVKKKRRPARPQVDPSTIKTGELPPQTGTVFNIWYNKWSGGDREDKYLSKHHAEGRCNIAKDSGYTRADKVAGSYFCLFFAKGLCPRGHECEYLHRLPTLHDLFNPNVDCFGRDKHSDYRDDMGGVGSFMRQNRTLYVGRIHVSDDIEEIVARHFAEWGQVERIRVLNARGVAFITYTNEANSQFAKEAMAHQSLDHNEILNVRWATVDPNPMAQAREARKIEEKAAEAVRRALPAEFVAEIEGRDPEARKRKKIEGSFGLPGYEAPDEVWYARGSAVDGSAQLQAIENGHDGVEGVQQQQIEATPAQGTGAASNGGGLLSGSTLAAIRGYSVHVGGGGGGGGMASNSQHEPASASTNPLVSYGSSDEED